MTVRNEQPVTLAAGDDYDDFDDLLDASSLGAPHVVAARQDLPEAMRRHLREAATAARNAPLASALPASGAAHQGGGYAPSVVVDTSSSFNPAERRAISHGTGVAVIDFGTTASTAAVWDPAQPAQVRIGLWGTPRSGKSTFLNALLDAPHGLPFQGIGYSGASGPGDLQIVDLPGAGSADAQLEKMLRSVHLHPRSGQNREIFDRMRHLAQTLDGPLPIIVFGAEAVAVPPPVDLLFGLSATFDSSTFDIAPASAHSLRVARGEWAPADTGGHGLRMALTLMRRDCSCVLHESRAARSVAHHRAAVLWHHLARTAAAAAARSTVLGILGSGGSWRGGFLSGGAPGALSAGLGFTPIAAYVVAVDRFRGYLPRTGAPVLTLCPAVQGTWPNVRQETLPRNDGSGAGAEFGGTSRLAGAAQARMRFTDGFAEISFLSSADTGRTGRDVAVAVLLAFPSPAARVGGHGTDMKARARPAAPPGRAAQQACRWQMLQLSELPGPGERWGRTWQDISAHLAPAGAAHAACLLSPELALLRALPVATPGSYQWPAAGVPPEVRHGESQEGDRGKLTGAVTSADAGRTRTPAQRRPSRPDTGLRTRRRWDVHRDLKAWVLNEHGHTEGIPLRLTYAPSDPYVVCLIFRTSRGQVVWNLARELLSQALDRRAGTGDVIAWSQEDEHLAPEERSTFLLLRPGGRLALLGVPREQLRAFLAQTWRSVASGAEYDLCMLALADIERELHSAAWTPDNG